MNVSIIIELPKELIVDIDKIAKQLCGDFRGRYLEKEQYYIIIKDMGNVDSYTIKQMKIALHEATSRSNTFILYCNELLIQDPKRRSSLVYTLRGQTNRLSALCQNIESSLYTKLIERDEIKYDPFIEIAQKVLFRQLPIITPPVVPINIGTVILAEKKQSISKIEYKKLEEYPLFGGELYITSIEDSVVVCENDFGKEITFDQYLLPMDAKEKDVIKKVGANYTIEVEQTRIRALKSEGILDRIKRQRENIPSNRF